MFDKILIANRGEIACRVMATARRMGIATVAVYSDADAGAKHVAMADEAVRIGEAAAADSYLKGARIIEAALATGAQAIHPGYGFLSENPGFVEAVEKAGLVFIGPPADAIRAMGLKDAAKALMERANVPVVPGYHGDNQDADFLAAEAEKIGYPVLIKARAGGGGKGMRLVEKPADFAAALEGAQREAQASFDDPACLIEKFVTNPRHVELQVFGDAHGNVLHLFERDCSLQRRHQKVIEEAPAPGMTDEMRAAMGQAAVEAARAIGYRGAGTVEFIVDGSGPLDPSKFWFMEMNTRLQVEHPVSEAITGLDFVELQLRVAGGEPLPMAQEDLSIDGHSFEARIYAEDAGRGFLPATGRLDFMAMPEGAAFELAPVRVDSGVREGDAISPHYDPMIAKLIVHGADRAEALARLRKALAECRIAGLTTNIAFLGALARHQGFAAGEVDTGLIGRDQEALVAQPEADATVYGLAALAVSGLLDQSNAEDPWRSLRGWRHWSDSQVIVRLSQGETIADVALILHPNGRYDVNIGEESVAIAVSASGPDRYRVTCAGRQTDFGIARAGGDVVVFAEGHAHAFHQPDPLAGEGGDAATGDHVHAPMPGLVKAVRVAIGDAVTAGQALMVLEAMKMEHTLTAPRDGLVAELTVAEGAQVTDGALLLALEPEDG